MDDALERVLRLVADGRLTAEEAQPILAALDAAGAPPPPPRPEAAPPPPPPADGDAPAVSALRIEVREGNRQVVNLRLPLALGRFALDRVPGLAGEYAERVREALRAGARGPILEVDDVDGDGVRIVLE